MEEAAIEGAVERAINRAGERAVVRARSVVKLDERVSWSRATAIIAVATADKQLFCKVRDLNFWRSVCKP